MGEADKKQDEVKLNISQRWNDPNADQALKVVSSDGMIFYIPAYIFQSQSVALREMIKDIALPTTNDSTPVSADPSKTLSFTDDTLESSSVLHFFLSVIGDKSLEAALEESTTTDYVPLYHYTMMFAKKWDCPQALKILKAWLFQLSLMGQKHPHIKPLDVFIIAAKFDERQTAAEVIAKYKRSEDCLAPPHSGRWGFIPSNQELHMDNIPIQAWEEIPPVYTYALNRSYSTSRPDYFNDYRRMGYCSHCKNTHSNAPERAAYFLECLDK